MLKTDKALALVLGAVVTACFAWLVWSSLPDPALQYNQTNIPTPQPAPVIPIIVP